MCLSFSTMAVVETYEFDTPALEQRYHHFTDVLRCPKCQNQNLTGSNSPIAQDLRRELALQLKAGKSDQEIIDFMVARFGDFVLYEPQLKKNTLVLWGAPALFLFMALAVVFLLVRKKGTAVVDTAYRNEHSVDAVMLSRGLSLSRARWSLAVFAGLALIGAIGLYLKLGARETLQISSLSQAFYQEVEQASKAGRVPNKQQADELLVVLEKHLQKKPDDLQSRYLLGSSYAFAGDFEQAIPHYKTYLMAVPTDERVLTEYVQILYIAANRRLTERVQFVVGRALALNPHNQEVLNLLAMHWFEAEDYDQAIGYWEKILLTIGAQDPGRSTVEKAIAAAKQLKLARH